MDKAKNKTTQLKAGISIHKLFNLDRRTALVTGASGYLGHSMSQALAEAGARVIVSSRRKKNAESVAKQLKGIEEGKHLGIELDQMNESSLNTGFDELIRQAGSLDILVNNGHFPLADDWTQVTGDKFQQQFGNATAYFLLARRLRDWSVEHNRPASIIMLGSMYGVVGSYPDAYEGVCPASPVAYHALKGGIIHMTRHLAVYWAQDGIRVNCLSPGPFPSPEASRVMVDRLCAKSPMGRMGIPEELKGAIVFLASDASSYMTGQNLIIDGGWTAW